MFNKKKKAELDEVEEELKQAEESKEETKEEVIDKVCPNIEYAHLLLRDYIREYVLCLYNISKQQKADIITCLNFLVDYIKDHAEIDNIIEHIDNKELIQYSNIFERSGYTIKVDINKKK